VVHFISLFILHDGEVVHGSEIAWILEVVLDIAVNGGINEYDYLVYSIICLYNCEGSRRTTRCNPYPDTIPNLHVHSASKRMQHPPRLINLERKIRRPATIGMIRKHQSLIPFREFGPRHVPVTPG
jgi:hypothetical protein